MWIWVRVCLVVLAAAAGAAGLKLLRKAGQGRQTADVLADRRNGVSCLLLSLALLAAGIWIAG